MPREFEIGDLVRDKSSKQVGTVIGLTDCESKQYEVEFGDGRVFVLGDDDLEMAWDRILTPPKIMLMQRNDPVNHPKHYTSHPSGIECIEITEHMNFCLGNAFKYIWRAGLKSESPIEDLEKAIWYLDREIKRLKKGMR